MRSLPVLTILITAALLCAPIAATADFETSIERTAAKGLQVVVQVRIDGTLENPDATPSGSGVIVDPQGLIITNHHVVQKAKRINIRLHGDDADYTATVLGEDARNDLALIRIDTDRELPYARIADSDKLKPGQWVVAIGNPLGLVSTVSAGVVSHVARETPEHIIPFIQFDAIIDKGSSGGPVFNLDAEVVGIVKSGADRASAWPFPATSWTISCAMCWPPASPRTRGSAWDCSPSPRSWPSTWALVP